MEYRTLGTTGVRVSALCLGAMMFGAWGNTDEDESVSMIHRALDAGINFIDTADVYAAGESEEIVGRALKDRRDDVVLATKVHGEMGEGPNERGNSRLWIIREVEASLRRLGTDHIDLYQLHRPDPETDIEDTLAALSTLVEQGKIRYFGSSTFPAFQIVEAHWASARRGLHRLSCEQPPYSIFARAVEADVLPVCRQYGMGVIVWSPLAGGWLSGKYRRGEEPPEGSRMRRYAGRDTGPARRFQLDRPGNQRKLDLVEDLAAVADKAGHSLTHLAIAFTLAHPAVTSAIIGPRTPEQLEDLLAGADVRLDGDTLDAIDEVVEPGETVEEADRGWAPPVAARSAREVRRLRPICGGLGGDLSQHGGDLGEPAPQHLAERRAPRYRRARRGSGPGGSRSGLYSDGRVDVEVLLPTDRFLRACRREPVDRTPVWFMRQAGRYLPEYRRLREGRDILAMIRSPELAVEATLQPLARMPLDAAILFSDIMVPVAAMGIDVRIDPGVGPVVPSPIRSDEDLDRLRPLDPGADVPFVLEAVRELIRVLKVPLIGFAGAPFTLASYLIEGGPSRDHARTKALMHAEPAAWSRLMELLGANTLGYLRAQVSAGVAAVQVFDSWAGALDPEDYAHFVLPTMREVFAGLAELGVPRIHFGVGTGELLTLMRDAGADVVGVDWRVPLHRAWERIGFDVGIQGNLDPAICLAPWDVVETKALAVLRRALGRPGHVFNLGHGVLPDTPPDTLARLVDLVHERTARDREA